MNAARVAARRPLIAYLTIIAGAVIALAALLGLLSVGSLSWLYPIGEIVLGASFIVIAATVSLTLLARIAFWVGGIAWVVLGLIAFVPGLGFLGIVATVLALVGSLLAGILVFLRSTFARRGNVIYLIAMILAALILLLVLLSSGLAFAAILTLLFGAALIVAGVFILRNR
jgi:hypothetical protein